MFNNRAISISDDPDSLYYQLTKGEFVPFLNIVKESQTDVSLPKLVLCFRSNKERERIVIYYKNHMLWELSMKKSGKKCIPVVKISGNHARYTKKWEEKLKEIGVENIEKHNSKQDFRTIRFEGEKIYEGFPRKTVNILSDMIDDFFDTKKCYDYFNDRERKMVNGKIGKPNLIEKERQQEFYLNNDCLKGGIFVYDLEFAQEYRSEKEKKAELKEKKSNQTDAMAIRFDKDGTPEKLVFVEIKSKKSSLVTNKCNLTNHLVKMDEYITMHEDYVESRVDEAIQIMELYKRLGIRSIPDNFDSKSLSILAKKGMQEILIVLTDEAANYCQTPNGEKWINDSFKRYDKENYDLRYIVR